MASLVLSGDTSGSITVSAPAVAGSTTQTLVATSGTLAPLVSGTSITLTNQTAPDFTSIPSWVKRITLMFNGVSSNGTSNYLVQIGDAGGYETSGYVGGSQNYNTNPAIGVAAASTGWSIQSGSATNTIYGSLVITNISGNVWVISGTVYINSTTMMMVNGAKTLSETLTSVRLFIDGTQFFDAGTINILYE